MSVLERFGYARVGDCFCRTRLSDISGVKYLFSIDPTVATPDASVVYTFPNATGISGIAEISPDVFALVTGDWDLANMRAYLGMLAVMVGSFCRILRW